MIIADMHNVNAVHNGLVSISEVYYGETLVWKKGSGFTSPYNREVECLIAKDTNTYIITDIKFKDLTKYAFEIKGWCGLGATMLYGCRDNAGTGNTNQVAMLHGANGNYQMRIMDGTSAFSFTASDTTPHTFYWTGNSYAMDGRTSALSSAAKSRAEKIDCAEELALFGCNSGGFVDNAGKDRCIYYFKLWYEDELIADYIPVIDNNGIPCMYDNVSEKLIKCSGENGKFDFKEKENDLGKILR